MDKHLVDMEIEIIFIPNKYAFNRMYKFLDKEKYNISIKGLFKNSLEYFRHTTRR